MIFKLKNYMRRRQMANLQRELERVRMMRMFLTQKEFNLRGRMAVLEAA
ncbi:MULTISPECIES: hypothetical protein [unclassified Janthinobacterium]|nr:MULTISPECIES: hypothetical protein [unclassified Janthinobacterium]MEC5161688.1 hypothetical protein [Janthinobacterium sp. CG_S6]